MIEIADTKVYGVSEAVHFIGLSYGKPYTDFELAKKLAKRPLCSGHDSYLKGITVTFTLTAPHWFIIELQRYHFIDIVMSTSKMHQLKKECFLLDNLPKTLSPKIREGILELYFKWEKKEIDFETLLDNLPMGFQLQMFMVANYLQLKTIYYQRKNHKLKDWHKFCGWIKGLPLLEEILE